GVGANARRLRRLLRRERLRRRPGGGPLGKEVLVLLPEAAIHADAQPLGDVRSQAPPGPANRGPRQSGEHARGLGARGRRPRLLRGSGTVLATLQQGSVPLAEVARHPEGHAPRVALVALEVLLRARAQSRHVLERSGPLVEEESAIDGPVPLPVGQALRARLS